MEPNHEAMLRRTLSIAHRIHTSVVNGKILPLELGCEVRSILMVSTPMTANACRQN